MDARQLKQLARSLAIAGSRRGWLRLAIMFPVVGSCFIDGSDTTAAAGRHQRRKQRHKHERGQHKLQRQGKGREKKKRGCARSGQSPRPGKRCCKGLVEDARGVCSESTCAGECGGCCDAAGACQAGDSDAACGAAGATCQPCGGGQVCRNGGCQCVADVCPSGCSFATVQAAIDAAAPGSTITICPGRYAGTVDIGKNLTLTGAGQGNDPAVDTILDADGHGRAVRVGVGRVVTLSGLRITGGWLRREDVDVDLGGGGLLNRGTLTMHDCTVDSNVFPAGLATSPPGGGGISNGPGRTMTVTNCIISGNSVLAGSAPGGGVLNLGTLTLNGCAIVNNTSSNSGGGVAGHVDSHTTLTGCTVSGNSASLDGGGLFSTGGAAMTIIDCQITHNEAPRHVGGGAFVDSGSFLDVQGSTVGGNSARAGGGIYGTPGSTLALRAGTIIQNNRARGHGALPNIQGWGAGVLNAGAATIAASITGNHADAGGGGVFNLGTITTCTGTVDGNTADSSPVTSNCVDSAPGTGCTCPA